MNNLNEVRKNFGQRAAEYRLSSTHNNSDDLQRMIELIKPNSRDYALDVATGGGHTAIALAQSVENVMAIDITPEMLAEAKTAAAQKGLTNLVFQVEDVHNLTIPDSQFDIVASRFAAHHFSNINKSLAEMCRVLKTGGRFYILDCSVVNGEEMEKEINRLEYLRDSSHQCSYSPRLWQKLLADLPLTINYTALYKSQYELPEWFDRMGTLPRNREEIFKILDSLSAESKLHYSFGADFITTYRYEILATKNN